MLISKKSKVVSVKLISGEEIIAKLTDESGAFYALYTPLMFVLSSEKTEDGRNNVVFAPWMVGVDMNSNIEIKKDKVLAVCSASKVAEEQYLEAIGESTKLIFPGPNA